MQHIRIYSALPFDSKKKTYTCTLIYTFRCSPLLTAITPRNLDVMDIFYGRKNVPLGVNGNPAYIMHGIHGPR